MSLLLAFYGALAREHKLQYRLVKDDALKSLEVQVFTVGKWRTVAYATRRQLGKGPSKTYGLLPGGMSNALFEKVSSTLLRNGGMPWKGTDFHGFVLVDSPE